MRWLPITLTAAVILAHACSAARADPITQLVVFGDQFSDTGNTLVFGQQPTQYTNGAVWVVQLAHDLGVAAPLPQRLGGTDYAYGWSRTGPTAYNDFAENHNLFQQVNAFLGQSRVSPGQLMVIWAGLADVWSGQSVPGPSVANIGASVMLLAAAGARQFLIPNMIPLGDIPEWSVHLAPSAEPAMRRYMNVWAQEYNADLSSEVTALRKTLGVRITVLDTYRLFKRIESDPQAFELSDAWNSAVWSWPYNSPPPANGYLYWDTINPTTAGHQVIGDAAFASLRSAPEPTALMLAATSVIGLIAVRQRKARPR
jgi:phospholipase/lecithinase/hemolysin